MRFVLLWRFKMKCTVEVASPEDMISVWALNHRVYCEELGQHALDPSGSKVDRMHSVGVFFVAKVDGSVVGMLSITPPGAGGVSTLGRISSSMLRNSLHGVAEIRLLAVERQYRAKGIYDALMLAVMGYCSLNKIDRVVISAIGRQYRLYTLMGFKVLCGPIKEGGCEIRPMLLTRSDFEASVYRKGRLASMERK